MAVYFMSGEGIPAIKIGFTNMRTPERRLHSCQSWSPVRLQLEAVDHNGDLLTESELLWRFRADRLHGEWFSPTASLRQVIDAVQQGRGVPNGWYLPAWVRPTGYSYPRGMKMNAFMQQFSMSRSDTVKLGGVDVPDYGLSLGAIPRALAHLRAAGHDITYLDLLEPAAPEQAAA